MPFKNFKMWRQRLPHWRADDVTYYATFRHRRELSEAERKVVFQNLCKSHGRRFELVLLCVLPEQTELVFRVMDSSKGEPYELSKVKSYDRIIRDDAELEERFQSILDSPVKHELCEDPEEYGFLFVADH
jgi:hypothetical protein